jgi:hypothetical protein
MHGADIKSRGFTRWHRTGPITCIDPARDELLGDGVPHQVMDLRFSSKIYGPNGAYNVQVMEGLPVYTVLTTVSYLLYPIRVYAFMVGSRPLSENFQSVYGISESFAPTPCY